MRLNALRMLSSSHETPPAAMVAKLFWATLHRDLGELAMDVLGPESTLRSAPTPGGTPDSSRLQRLFLFLRDATNYAGTKQLQRNTYRHPAPGRAEGRQKSVQDRNL